MSAGSGAVSSSSLPVKGWENRSRWAWSDWRSMSVASASSGASVATLLRTHHVTERDAVPARVELVGQDRVADVREVDADLVRAAGLRLAPDQREIAEPFDDLVERHRGLAAVLGGADGHLLADRRMEPDRPLDVIAVALRGPVDQRQVLLVDLPQLELETQPAMGQLVLDDDEQAGRVAVEPVDDPRPMLAGQGRERVVVELERVDQGARASSPSPGA